ncbi:MAG: hypothetical protein D4R90_01410 [Nitrosopumilales archaeon]|nr:MAG: hypothetical protein D4R90_01410 [Nitrosopumilales archaeon]
MAHCWSGNKLAVDPISFVSKILSEISGKNSRKGLSIQAIVVGIILLVLHIVQVTADPNSSISKIIEPYLNGIIWYAVIVLIAMAYLVIQRPFLTPEVKTAMCPVCKIPMSSIRLHCENCKGDFNMKKP